jgi:hypothetical protein
MQPLCGVRSVGMAKLPVLVDVVGGQHNQLSLEWGMNLAAVGRLSRPLGGGDFDQSAENLLAPGGRKATSARNQDPGFSLVSIGGDDTIDPLAVIIGPVFIDRNLESLA